MRCTKYSVSSVLHKKQTELTDDDDQDDKNNDREQDPHLEYTTKQQVV